MGNLRIPCLILLIYISKIVTAYDRCWDELEAVKSCAKQKLPVLEDRAACLSCISFATVQVRQEMECSLLADQSCRQIEDCPCGTCLSKAHDWADCFITKVKGCKERPCECVNQRRKLESCTSSNRHSMENCEACLQRNIPKVLGGCSNAVQMACGAPELCTDECGNACKEPARAWLQDCPAAGLDLCRPFTCHASGTFQPTVAPSYTPTVSPSHLPSMQPSELPTSLSIPITTPTPTASDRPSVIESRLDDEDENNRTSFTGVSFFDNLPRWAQVVIAVCAYVLIVLMAGLLFWKCIGKPRNTKVTDTKKFFVPLPEEPSSTGHEDDEPSDDMNEDRFFPIFDVPEFDVSCTNDETRGYGEDDPSANSADHPNFDGFDGSHRYGHDPHLDIHFGEGYSNDEDEEDYSGDDVEDGHVDHYSTETGSFDESYADSEFGRTYDTHAFENDTTNPFSPAFGGYDDDSSRYRGGEGASCDQESDEGETYEYEEVYDIVPYDHFQEHFQELSTIEEDVSSFSTGATPRFTSYAHCEETKSQHTQTSANSNASIATV